MIHPDSFISAGYEYADIEHFVAAPFFRKKFTVQETTKADIIIGVAAFTGFSKWKEYYKGRACAIYQQSRRYCLL